ncbi:MAG: 3-dehydroquinate synthase [Bacteroidota bacterium]
MPPSPAVVVDLPHGRDYAVHFEPLATLPRHLREAGLGGDRALVVTDATVGPLYLDRLGAALRADGWRPEAATVPAGEASKHLDRLGDLYDWALGLEIDRGTPVVALGGGVVGDLAGFLAATLLRGLPLVQVPTTVIAQVDSAIGGKTGVNHAAGKNLIGAFHQPRLVLADPATLATLAERDFRSGLAEAVKHALIADADLAGRLGTGWDALLARDPGAVAALVRDAAAVKARVVGADELEGGVRALLNFGHTFGHAIEREAGYGALTHGEAVAVGMRAALHLSASLRLGDVCGDALPAPFDRADALVRRLAPPPIPASVPTTNLTAAMATDKKRTASGLRFVVLDDIGAARIASGVPEAAVAAAWAFARTEAAS